MANAALAVIRPVVRLGSVLAPRLTGRVAFDVFCRPSLAGGMDAKQQQALAAALKRLEAADRTTVTHAFGYVETFRFGQQTGHSSRGKVLLVHGWTGRAAFMLGFVPHLLKKGFEVVTLDLPGHGASSGRHLTMPIAMDALSAVQRIHGPFKGIIGHSFGGAVAVTALAGVVPAYRPLAVERAVLISAPNRMGDYFRSFGRTIGLSSAAQDAMNLRVRHVAATDLARFDGGARLAELAVPTLVIHDADDREIPFSDAQAMAGETAHVSLLRTEGLGHRRILQSAMVAKAAADHFAAG